jgi:LuxR family maltose regulon positive regulatory protein
MISSVLKTKLAVPPNQANLMSRSRLIKLLNSGLDRKLIIVSAPAGFGKTTLLGEWAGGHRSFSWFSLDEGDNDPLRFWIHFISSLQKSRTGIGRAALEMIQSYSHTQLPVETCLTTLINEIFEDSHTFTLILDDYHLISNHSIHTDLKFLIDHMPDRLHLVISTRIKVPFSVGRLRLKNQLMELGADDLRFTPQEITLFARRVIGRNLAEVDIPALGVYSEGWAAGLQIAAIAIKKDLPGDVPVVSQGYEHMIEYFMEEIFSSHPENIQSFLLDTSILERLNGELCNAVTGRQDSAAMLETLCAGNMLIVPLDHEHREYRYHVLFADTLRGRFRRLDNGRMHALHSRACRWFLENNMPNEAIRHAIEAEDWDHAADLVNKYAGIALLRGESSTALRWMQSLPPKHISTHQGLSVSYAWALYLSNLRNRTGIPYEVIEQFLRDAEKMYVERNYGARSLDARARQVLGHANALRVYMAYEKGEPAGKIIDLCKRSLTGAGGDFPIVRAGVYAILGMTYMNIDEPEAAAKALHEARSIGFVEGLCFSVLTVDGFRAFLARLRGRLGESESICIDSCNTISEAFIKNRRLPPEMLGLIRMASSAVHLEKNDIPKAARLLSESIRAIRLIKDSFATITYNALLARLRLHQGADLKDVFSTLAEIGLMDQSCPGAGLYSAALRIHFLLQRSGNNAASVQSAFHLADQHGLQLSDQTVSYNNPFSKHWYFTEQFAVVRLSLAEAHVLPRGHSRLPLEEVIPFLDLLCGRVRQQGWGELEMEGLMLKALAHHARGDNDRALTALECSLSLAEPEGYVLPFMENGEPMADLLRLAMNSVIQREFVGRLLDVLLSGHKENRPAPALPDDLFNAQIEPLSRQETAVLKLLADGLSNQEIADELCIALTTVKTHNYNIFSKLNVKKRYQAVKKAKELSLL